MMDDGISKPPRVEDEVGESLPTDESREEYQSLSTHELVKRVLECRYDCPLALAQEVVARGSEAVPFLCRIVADAASWWDEDSAACIHAMHLLGAIGDPAAVYALLAPLEHDEPSDFITEDMPSILARLGPEAIPALRDFVQDDAQDAVMRSVAYDGLVGMAVLHPELQDDVRRIGREVALHCLAEQALMPAVMALSLAGYRDPADREILQRVFQTDLVDDDDFCGWDELEEVFAKGPYAPQLAYCTRDPMAYFAPETQAELRQMWLELDEVPPPIDEIAAQTRPAPPPPPVGRNEPCPCGSGKKYKRCCGKR